MGIHQNTGSVFAKAKVHQSSMRPETRSVYLNKPSLIEMSQGEVKYCKQDPMAFESSTDPLPLYEPMHQHHFPIPKVKYASLQSRAAPSNPQTELSVQSPSARSIMQSRRLQMANQQREAKGTSLQPTVSPSNPQPSSDPLTLSSAELRSTIRRSRGEKALMANPTTRLLLEAGMQLDKK